MAVPANPLRGVVRSSRWLYFLGLIVLSAMVYDIFLRNQHANFLNFSLTNMATANASGESPDKAFEGCQVSHLGQERCWAGLCKDLHKARNDALDYFESQVLMKVQHRFPMDNGTLYNQLQSLKAGALYRFRSQIGVKDVTGHFWDDLEVDMERTILSSLELNQMVVKGNIDEEDQQVATLNVESDCDDIDVSQIKVICLKKQITKNAKESQRREYLAGKRHILEREYARRVNNKARRIHPQLVETENKLKQEREAFKHDKEILKVKELLQKKHEEEKRRELDRKLSRRANSRVERILHQLVETENKLKQEREACKHDKEVLEKSLRQIEQKKYEEKKRKYTRRANRRAERILNTLVETENKQNHEREASKYEKESHNKLANLLLAFFIISLLLSCDKNLTRIPACKIIVYDQLVTHFSVPPDPDLELDVLETNSVWWDEMMGLEGTTVNAFKFAVDLISW